MQPTSKPNEDSIRVADSALADHCRLNVLWMHGVAGGQRALELTVPGLSLADALRTLYRRVERVDGPLDGLPFESGTFELVTAYGWRPGLGELKEIRRCLCRNGIVLIGVANRWWRGRPWCMDTAAVSVASRRKLEKSVRQAGFAEVHPYWIEPSLAVPRNLIPAVTDRVVAFETLRASELGASRARSLVTRWGPHSLLYPALLLVAKA